MIKKIITTLITMFLIWMNFSVNATDSSSTFNMENNTWTMEVSKDSIFVWKALKNTSAIDLFKMMVIDGKTIDNNPLNVLDIRYVTPDKVDYKVNSDTDIIDANSDVYILFKNVDNWGLVKDNSTVYFETKNFTLKEIWTVSDIANNSYNKIYDVKYVSTPKVTNNTDTSVNNKVINNNILADNNTWIKSNMLLILIWIISLVWLLFLPKQKIYN